MLFNKGDYEKAREFYREALQNDSSCVEARYNLGESVASWAQSRVELPIGGHVNVLPDYKETVPEKDCTHFT